MAKKRPSQPVPSGTRQYLTTAKAAEYLGLEPRTLRTYIVKRLIRRQTIGKNLVFTREDLDVLGKRLPLKRGRPVKR